MSDGDYKTIDQQVGLVGGTVLLVGTVVGITVFLLPGELIGEAGPSIVLAMALTAIPMTFAVLSLLQLGGAIPVAGGLYVYGSRLVGPFWGFLAIWLMVPAIWSVLLFTSIGFADFTNFFIDVPEMWLMMGILTAFLLLNLLGITIVTQVQLMMVVGIVLGMLAFIIPGSLQVDTANFTPMFDSGDPGGAEGFLVALVSLYIPFQGFSMIIELGEELENPVKNIPRVLGLGMLISVVISLAFVFVFVGVENWEVLAAEDQAAVAYIATEVVSSEIGAAVALAALLGAFTTLNALLTSYSRTIMRAARDELVPGTFAEIHPKTGVPYWSIILLGLPPILLIGVGSLTGLELITEVILDAVALSLFLALILLFANFVAGIALWRLPKIFPKRYEYSIYKLPMPVLKFVAVGISVISAVFWLGVLGEMPMLIGLIVGLVLIGYVVYQYRIRRYQKQGIDLKARMALLHKHEQIGGSNSEGDD